VTTSPWRGPWASGSGGPPFPSSMRHLPRQLVGFAPCYARHLVLQPFRHQTDMTEHGRTLSRRFRRHRIALFDGTVDLILRGYEELGGERLRPETGLVLVLLSRLAFTIDDEFEERRSRDQSTDLLSILSAPQVDPRLREWRAFMSTYPCYPEIAEFLNKSVASLLTKYVENEDSRDLQQDFASGIVAAELDSGGLLEALAHVVAILNSSGPSERVLREVSSVGVGGKLADDVADFRLDLRAGRPNLLRALVQANPPEYATVSAAVPSDARMGLHWWRRSCPDTFTIFAAAAEQQYRQVSSHSLRRAWGLIWLPAYMGATLQPETRGRV
jgi:hypothetical protein